MVLSFGEALLSIYCRLILLPVARSPFARTPLKIGDHFSSKGARLLERAVPRLKDKVHVSLSGAQMGPSGEKVMMWWEKLMMIGVLRRVGEQGRPSGSLEGQMKPIGMEVRLAEIALNHELGRHLDRK